MAKISDIVENTGSKRSRMGDINSDPNEKVSRIGSNLTTCAKMGSQIADADQSNTMQTPINNGEEAQTLIGNDDCSQNELIVPIQDQQETINTTHPFGIRLWNSSLYKKERESEDNSDVNVTSPLSSLAIKMSYAERAYGLLGSIWWVLLFGWILTAVCWCLSAILICLWTPRKYGIVLYKLGLYYLWPVSYCIQLISFEPIDCNHGRLFNSNISDTTLLLDDYVMAKPKFSISAAAFYLLFAVILAPVQLLVSAICWLLVVFVPMARANMRILGALAEQPLDLAILRKPSLHHSIMYSESIVTNVFRTSGLKYFKHSVNGINIVIINLTFLVFLSIFDEFVLSSLMNLDSTLHSIALFTCCILAVVPLSYFIGMAVSSISAQSSHGLGAVINASFGSIVEIILYCFAIKDGKAELVEGGLVGSFLGCMLLLPGVSMIVGGLWQKQQRFNAKSASVSSTMLIMAMIGCLIPTLFYHIMGKYDMKCTSCSLQETAACSGCEFHLLDPTLDSFYLDKIRPLMYLSAIVLPSAYLIGLMFSLGTHKFHIYDRKNSMQPSFHGIPNSSEDHGSHQHLIGSENPSVSQDEIHGAPTWSKLKSGVVLLVSTMLFSIVAEIIIRKVDSVILSTGISERFLGMTIVALAPSFAEFYNAAAFAIQGNIALSLEIGSAYTLQVAMLQIPTLVLFSALYSPGAPLKKSFTLIFPQYDIIVIFLSIFLLNYTYSEGNSNYFKGAILFLSYIVLLVPFSLNR